MDSKFLNFILVVLACMVVFVVFSCLHTKKIIDADLQKRIGQMLVVGFRGTEAPPEASIVRAIRELNLGGVVLFDKDVPTQGFPRNIVDPAQIKDLIRDLQKASRTPLFVAVDAEGGRVNRLKPEYGFAAVPGHQELGAKNDAQETRRVSSTLAQELSEAGLNVNFAPVVDLNLNRANPVIGALGRSFSEDEEIVVRHARAFIEGQHDYGILTAIKHFPGHGSSREDSHLGLVDITATYQDKELIPFERLIREGAVDMVMTAHLLDRKVDPEHPVTLSRRFLGEILRGKLGFDGVVVSDDMHMGAITAHYGLGEALVLAIQAGCDLLILSNNGNSYDERAPYQAVEAIFDAVRTGRIPASRIVEASDRIGRLKNRLKKEP
ncbi:MAG: beta-N-acetylhexosaminidase [Candidatus Omnitrophota bacterium]